MQADTEHQENDADLGEFVGELLIRHIARRERAHQHASKQIAHQGRDANTLRNYTENECQHEANDDSRNQRGIVLHAAFCRMGAWDARLM